MYGPGYLMTYGIPPAADMLSWLYAAAFVVFVVSAFVLSYLR